MAHPCHSEESTRGDHRQGRVLKPVIKELVRTEVHPPLLELLVDKILVVSNVKAKGRYTEAFRIWLSDGEKSIQGESAEQHCCVWFPLRHDMNDMASLKARAFTTVVPCMLGMSIFSSNRFS
jgi:hypothetical protein